MRINVSQSVLLDFMKMKNKDYV